MKLFTLLLVVALVAAAAAESSWRLRNAHALTRGRPHGKPSSSVLCNNSDCKDLCSRACVYADGLCYQDDCYCKYDNYLKN